jgi:ATP-binding cassette subfamily F protein uup
VFEGGGQVNAYVGGYQDWLRQRAAPAKPGGRPALQKKPSAPKVSEPVKPKKRSYKDQRELDQLPARIEALDAESAKIQALLANPDLYRESPDKVNELNARMQQIEQELAHAYKRWEALEG